jgi:parallel beta-helix repeat protein
MIRLNFNIKSKKTKLIVIGSAVLVSLLFLMASGVILAQKILPQNVQIAIVQNFPAAQSLAKIAKVTDVFDFFDLFRSSKVPTYKLEVSRENLKKLSVDHRDYVKADLYFDDEKYKVKIRNKGYDPKHYKYAKKSWTIKFQDKELFLGKYKKIALTIPLDRRFLVEQFNNYRATKLGLFPPDSWFANLEINNSSSGIYFVTQYFSADYLALNRKVDSANLYSADIDSPGNPMDSVKAWKKYSSDELSDVDNFADIDELLELYDGPEDEFYGKIFNLSNEDNFFAWQIHSVLIKSFQQDDKHNIRAYFDPSRGKFEFIPWDVLIGTPDARVDFDYNPLVTKILLNPEYLHARNIKLWDYVGDPSNLEDDLKYYDELDALTEVDFNKDRKKSMSNSAVQNYNDLYRKYIEQIFNYVLDAFDSIEATVRIEVESNPIINLDLKSFAAQKISKLIVKTDSRLGGGSLNLYYGNTLIASANYSEEDEGYVFSDIELLMHSDRTVNKDIDENRPTTEKEPFEIQSTNYRFSLSAPIKFNDVEFELENYFTGKDYSPEVKFIDSRPFSKIQDINLSKNEFLARNPLFKQESGQIKIKKGQHYINNSIIVPNSVDFIIEPGVTLKFAKDVSILSYGKVTAKGTASSPIIFTAQNPSIAWGTFGLLDKNASGSNFEYVRFEYGGESYQNGVFMSGMLAAHFADTSIDHCIFQFANGDDALNIKNAVGVVKNSYFFKNGFDAIDFDFISEGEISNNYFKENGNDSIDLGGVDDIVIQNNFVEYSGDKGISIGERSEKPLVINNVVVNSNSGIAIKDSSDPVIVNNTIVGNKIGIASYQKKSIFKSGKGDVINTLLWENEKDFDLDKKSKTKFANSITKDPILDSNYYLSNADELPGDLEMLKKYYDFTGDKVPFGIFSKITPTIPF